jgi:ABC-type branched-subunit amino acid transport system ATPase component
MADVEKVSDRPLLELTDVNVRFGGIHAIRDISLHLDNDEIMAVIGQNGAGKSTLLNAICGLVSAKGSIRLRGVELLKKSPEEVIMSGIARSFQDPQLIESATVLENILLGLHSARLYRPVDQVLRRRRVRRFEAESVTKAVGIAERMNLVGDLDRPVSALTYGARKMVDIARAMIGAPDLLILDEPSSGLDVDEQLRVTDVLQYIWSERKIAVLMVEHHMDVVDRLASRVIELRAGELRLSDEPEALASERREPG